MRECANSNSQVVSDSEEFRATVMLVKGMHLALNESFKQLKRERVEEREQDRAHVHVLMEQTHVLMEQTNQQLSAMSASVQQLLQLSIEQQHHQNLAHMTTHDMDKHSRPPAPLLQVHRTCTQPLATTDGTAPPGSIPALGGLVPVSGTGANVAREIGVAEQEVAGAGGGSNAGGGDGDDAGGASGRGQEAGEPAADGINANGMSSRQGACANTSQLGCVCVCASACHHVSIVVFVRACRHVCGVWVPAATSQLWCVCARAATCQPHRPHVPPPPTRACKPCVCARA